MVSTTEELILAIQSQPTIWNKSLSEFSNRELKDKAWNQVCEDVDPNFLTSNTRDKQRSRVEIQSRWKILRGSFTKEVQKREKETANGAVTSKRKPFLYYETLKFLLPSVENSPTFSSLDEYPAIGETPRSSSTSRGRKRTWLLANEEQYEDFPEDTHAVLNLNTHMSECQSFLNSLLPYLLQCKLSELARVKSKLLLIVADIEIGDQY